MPSNGRTHGARAAVTSPWLVATVAAVNSRGHTLYQFGKDKNGKSACVGTCATLWPPLITSGKPLAAAGAKASLLGTTKRADGRTQVTYNHHPLYTFVKDTKKGQTKGEGLTAFGGQWDVIGRSSHAHEIPATTDAESGSIFVTYNRRERR